jgi:glutathione synthase
MPLRIALQMDPLEGININSDSTFLLGLGAQELGHQLFYYAPQDLRWDRGRLLTRAQKITFRREEGNHFTAEPAHVVDVKTSFDMILLRQDPPFDMGYITSTYLLDALGDGGPRIINNPTGVRAAPEKLLITHFPDLIPPTLVTGDADEAATFAKEYGEIVAKRLYGNAGRDVFRFKAGDSKLEDFVRQQREQAREPVMLQPFLKEIKDGDKRIILFGGKPVGAMRRVPAEGNFLANLAQGASAFACEITARDKDICAALAPTLNALGLYFVGIDVIGDYLIEINVTSPTALQGINRLYGLQGAARMEMLFWKGLD